MASLMEKLGDAVGQASTGIWGLGLLVYAATAAMFASLFVGEFGALFKTGVFGMHILLAFILGVILCGMALAQRMGLARDADRESDVGGATQVTADQIRQMVQDAVDNANNQSGQPQPDMSAFEDQLRRMQEAIDALQNNMGQYAAGTPGAGPININVDAMAAIMGGLRGHGGTMDGLGGNTQPTAEQAAVLQEVLRLLQQLKDKADDTNKKVTEMRDIINAEFLEMLRTNFEKIDDQFGRLRSNLGGILRKISVRIREARLSIEEKTELIRTEMAGVKQFLETTLPDGFFCFQIVFDSIDHLISILFRL